MYSPCLWQDERHGVVSNKSEGRPEAKRKRDSDGRMQTQMLMQDEMTCTLWSTYYIMFSNRKVSNVENIFREIEKGVHV